MKITNTNKIQQHKFNIAVLGPSKTGKTKLTETIKGKPLLCNADKGALTLADSSIACLSARRRIGNPLELKTTR